MRLLLVPKDSPAAIAFTTTYSRWSFIWGDDTWLIFSVHDSVMWEAAKSEPSVKRIPALTRSAKKLPPQVLSYLQTLGIIIEADDTTHDLLVKLTGNEDLEI